MNDGLSVVFVADVPQDGGASACLVELVSGLVSDWGVRCTVLLSSSGPLEEALGAAGARVFVTGHRAFLVSRPIATYRVVPKYIVELVRYLFCKRRALRKAASFVDFDTVDIVHSNVPRNDLGIMLSEKYGVPHVCHLREYSFEDYGCWSYRRHPADYLSKKSDLLISVSRACGSAWVEKGADEHKLRVVYDGVDISGVHPKTPRGSSTGTVSMVFLGGYNKGKGIDDAVGALKKLKERGYENVLLDVFGFGGQSDVERYRRQARKLGIAEKVTFNSVIQNVSSLLPSYDIGLVCSKSEAFGRVVIEFLASGLAVVGADRGSIPELLDNGRYGLLYDKENGPVSLADSLERLICDERLLRSFQEQGAVRAREFTVEKNARAIMGLYREITGGQA